MNLKVQRYYFGFYYPDKSVPAILGGEKVGKEVIAISQPIFISPLPLPLGSCKERKIKTDRRLALFILTSKKGVIK